jgi:hypothetical protein
VDIKIGDEIVLTGATCQLFSVEPVLDDDGNEVATKYTVRASLIVPKDLPGRDSE